MNERYEPSPGHRAVFLAGFFSGNVTGLADTAARGVLLEAVWRGPLSMYGYFLAIGLMGMWPAAFVGMSVRLVQEKTGRYPAGWLPPVVSAALVSAWIGYCMWPLFVGLQLK
jgi:hypothetical protein